MHVFATGDVLTAQLPVILSARGSHQFRGEARSRPWYTGYKKTMFYLKKEYNRVKVCSFAFQICDYAYATCHAAVPGRAELWFYY